MSDLFAYADEQGWDAHRARQRHRAAFMAHCLQQHMVGCRQTPQCPNKRCTLRSDRAAQSRSKTA